MDSDTKDMKPRPTARRRDQGAILLIVLMVMLGLMGLGVTALWLTSGNLQVGTNVTQRTMALYAAEAGVERARSILNAPGANINALLAGSVDLVTYPAPTGIDANGNPNEIGVILTDPGAGNAVIQNIQFPDSTKFGRTAGTAEDPKPQFMGTYSVWIRNDTADIRRGNFVNEPPTNNAAVVVRSRGLAPDGRTQVILEVALGWLPGMPPPPPPAGGSGSGPGYGGEGSDSSNSGNTGFVAQ